MHAVWIIQRWHAFLSCCTNRTPQQANSAAKLRLTRMSLTMSPVLVLADMLMSAVKRETRGLRLTCAAPATVIKRHLRWQIVSQTTVQAAWEGEALVLASPDTGQDRWKCRERGCSRRDSFMCRCKLLPVCFRR